jgi:hypothetical protein
VQRSGSESYAMSSRAFLHSAQRALPVDYLGAVVTVMGVVAVGWLTLDGRDIGQSVASIAQLLIGAILFGTALSYVLLLLVLEGVDFRGRAPRRASAVMLVVIPLTVLVSAVLTVVRT